MWKNCDFYVQEVDAWYALEARGPEDDEGITGRLWLQVVLRADRLPRIRLPDGCTAVADVTGNQLRIHLDWDYTNEEPAPPAATAISQASYHPHTLDATTDDWTANPQHELASGGPFGLFFAASRLLLQSVGTLPH